MSQHSIILLLGTNLGNRKNNLKMAKNLLIKEVGEIIKESKIIETTPEDFSSDNLFLNQTIKLNTSLSPIQLLTSIKFIEKKIGRKEYNRKKNELFKDRIIDIDILQFNQLNFKSCRLSIPHHQIKTRSFTKRILSFS